MGKIKERVLKASRKAISDVAKGAPIRLSAAHQNSAGQKGLACYICKRRERHLIQEHVILLEKLHSELMEKLQVLHKYKSWKSLALWETVVMKY